MDRYLLTSYAEASSAARAVYDDYLRLNGAQEPPNWLTSLGHDPKLLKAYWEKTRVCLLEGELPRLLKEMVMYVVSRENHARYDTAWHAHAVLRLDPALSYRDLLSLLTPCCTVTLPAQNAVALDFAARLARNANAVTDHDFDALAQVSFSPSHINELLGVIDLAMMLNCYTSAMRLPVDAQFQPERAH
jgi:alkylhydroperoxidase family enzyme